MLKKARGEQWEVINRLREIRVDRADWGKALGFPIGEKKNFQLEIMELWDF